MAKTAAMSSNPPLPASLVQRHLDWSHKQGRILTANGRANEYYAKEDFTEKELPHYFLRSGETHTVFRQFTQEQKDSPICGAWSRPLFCGTWEHSTLAEETVYNVQTRSLFVDLRIPTTRSWVLPSGATSLSSLSNEELRYYARQHVFAGFSRVTTEPDDDRPVCVRHHCIDWNYVGVPRSRPNKWWIETPNEGTAPPPMWKEWAYAVDENKQHYYMERWQRLENGGGNPGCLRIALRKCPSEGDPDGVLVVVGVSNATGRSKCTATILLLLLLLLLVQQLNVVLALSLSLVDFFVFVFDCAGSFQLRLGTDTAQRG